MESVKDEGDEELYEKLESAYPSADEETEVCISSCISSHFFNSYLACWMTANFTFLVDRMKVMRLI